MTTPHSDTAHEAALDWLIRQREADFADWEAFADWLASDPGHASIYQEMAAADADIADLLSIAPAAPQPSPAPVINRRRFGTWAGGALAASLIAGLSGYALLQGVSDPYSIQTAAGERRAVTLADGSRIELNGATRITLDRRNGRVATLDRGEALFTVMHDERRPFLVHVAGAELRDIGTVFNVIRDAGNLSVAVAEGAVLYNPDAEALTLDAGRTLTVRDGEAVVTLGTADPAVMTSWRQDRLVYDGAPIGLVASDIARNLGVSISAAPDVAGRPFRGVITLDRETDRFLARLGPLLDVSVRRGDQGWVLTARAQ